MPEAITQSNSTLRVFLHYIFDGVFFFIKKNHLRCGIYTET